MQTTNDVVQTSCLNSTALQVECLPSQLNQLNTKGQQLQVAFILDSIP